MAEPPLGTSRSRDKRYRLADPYLRFWTRFLEPAFPLLERGRSDVVLRRVREGWTAWQGRAVEPVVRESLARLLPDEDHGLVDRLPPTCHMRCSRSLAVGPYPRRSLLWYDAYVMTTHDDGALRAILPEDATQLPAAFVTAFNSGNAEHLDYLYSDLGVLVPGPGHPVTGKERAAADRHLLGFGLPLRAQLRHAYVSGDLALLIVDWSIHGTASNGEEVRLQGTATDVAQRGPDGLWRYAINNPFGAG
ncbi:nuclear transport factor 2 family protein [Nonomuraea africana]|uniref:Ketosteroid isomerase-like protein n=1 Tax=Nonomuraea africana TaxID=46171 RepID=A0ABR9KNY5_9ACTN|nr:nuclear transport factor 2 family protein [Nonomuraea africana]MBE1563729.1 ketosteroid isomerase-like protein [Nonomuraea africana]